jgi:ribosomal protein S6--L-glutamate ligase
MKLHFLLNERVHAEPNPIFVAASAILEKRGFSVTSSIPEEALLSPDRVRPQHDLYVLKSQTELALSLAGVLHDRGARFVNPYPACALLQNKITASSRLAASRVPVPRSWVTGDFALLRELVAAQPLILKPYRGHRGAGVMIVRTPADLASVAPFAQPMLVQQFIPGAGGDLKVYVIGEHVFAVRKSFSAKSFTVTGQPCPVTAQVRDIALRCGHAFGLGMYGIDIIEGPEGPVVVDLNYSPGFRGVPDAAPLIARYFEDFACGRATLPAVPPTLRLASAWGFLAEATA